MQFGKHGSVRYDGTQFWYNFSDYTGDHPSTVGRSPEVIMEMAQLAVVELEEWTKADDERRRCEPWKDMFGYIKFAPGGTKAYYAKDCLSLGYRYQHHQFGMALGIHSYGERLDWLDLLVPEGVAFDIRGIPDIERVCISGPMPDSHRLESESPDWGCLRRVTLPDYIRYYLDHGATIVKGEFNA